MNYLADVREGYLTSLVYGLVREQRYAEVIEICSYHLSLDPKNRACLSLIGYCAYNLEDYDKAIECYSTLSSLHPENSNYRLYWAQSQYMAGNRQDAGRTLSSVKAESSAQQHHISLVKSYIHYDDEDYQSCNNMLQHCNVEDPDVRVTRGCVAFRQGDFRTARELFADALSAGFKSQLAYAVALCDYKLGEIELSLRMTGNIREHGMRNHPELAIGSAIDITQSVGNSKILTDTALIEAFNLRCAIEFDMGNVEQASLELEEMPPRAEEELDPVSLHNQALVLCDLEPNDAVRKLSFLLGNPPFPPETFPNLLLLYLQNGLYDVAGDILSENADLRMSLLDFELSELLSAIVTSETAPEDAVFRLKKQAETKVTALRRQTKTMQDARLESDHEAEKAACHDYDILLEGLTPLLMSWCKVYWNHKNWEKVEQVLMQHSDFCGEDPTWRLNMAHALFMQDRWQEASVFYLPFFENANAVLDIPAAVLANLCVCYAMTGRRDEAEGIINTIDDEEKQLVAADPQAQVYHFCIVNLVIGTLYCSKGQYEFGISRVLRSLEPLDQRLSPDTWFYCKRCLSALTLTLAKQMILLKDTTIDDVVKFLDATLVAGEGISVDVNPLQEKQTTVAEEARLLKEFFVKYRVSF
ncbi:hypothetical protein PCE1_001171 [Barthelona sp. PCE]